MEKLRESKSVIDTLYNFNVTFETNEHNNNPIFTFDECEMLLLRMLETYICRRRPSKIKNEFMRHWMIPTTERKLHY